MTVQEKPAPLEGECDCGRWRWPQFVSFSIPEDASPDQANFVTARCKIHLVCPECGAEMWFGPTADPAIQ